MPEYIFPFEKLDVWQLTVDLADYVLELLDDFPPNQHIRIPPGAIPTNKIP